MCMYDEREGESGREKMLVVGLWMGFVDCVYGRMNEPYGYILCDGDT